MENFIDQAATEIERGKGCKALNGYLIGRTETKDEWRNLLKAVVSANTEHIRKNPYTPVLTIVEKEADPDQVPGGRLGITRTDLSGAPDRLVDRIFGVREENDLPRSYDCSDFKTK